MAFNSIINGQDGQPFVEAAMATLGPLENAQEIPDEVVLAYSQQVPATLRDVWENYGVGDLAGGRLRLCIPGILQPVVDQLFEGDPYFERQTRAIAFGAFGDLMLWHDRYQIVTVNMQLSSVEMSAFFKPGMIGYPDDVMYTRLLQMHPDTLDAYDEASTPMFARAKEVYGDLGELQIYGMNPPAPFHEAFTLERHNRTDVIEWLSRKIAASKFTFDDPEGGRFAVRPIGPLRTGETLRAAGEL